MRIVGVLDLMHDRVVRGVAGRRTEYRPVVSELCETAEPADVAEAFRRDYGIDELYLADLDAIAGAAPAWHVYETLSRRNFRLWIDAGVRVAAQGEALARAGVGVVVGLETAEGPPVVEALADERMLFSLDLKAGAPLGAWGDDAWAIATEAIRRGARRVLALDLTRVGVSEGVGTETLCARLVGTYPHVEAWAGGGVRDRRDLERLREAGVGVVLLATALHRRAVTRGEIAALARRGP